MKILSRGEVISSAKPELYAQFLDLLHKQISLVPQDYLEGLLELSSLMGPLGNLKEIIFEGQRGFNNEDVPVNPRLLRKFEDLESLLNRLGYELSLEDD